MGCKGRQIMLCIIEDKKSRIPKKMHKSYIDGWKEKLIKLGQLEEVILVKQKYRMDIGQQFSIALNVDMSVLIS